MSLDDLELNVQSINSDISKQISTLLVDTLNINPQRIFFNFTNLEGSFWGHSEGTY